MPTFEIPDGPTTVELERARSADPKTAGPAEGSAVFNVTNKSAERVVGRLSVQVAGSSKADWFGVDGDRERTFGAGETQTATIRITVPPAEAAGDYPFRLRVVAVNDPDNDHADGPVVTARVKGAATEGGGSRWWIWLLVALAVLAVIGVAAWLLWPKPDPDPVVVDGETNETVPEAPKVPKYVGQKIDAIPADANGYRIIRNETPNSGRPPRTVYEQDPAPESPLEPGNRVILSYEPGVVVPDLPANATFTSATNALRSAGLEPGSFPCDPTSGQPGAQVGRVTAFDPAPKTRVASGSKVNMRAIQQGPCLQIFIPLNKVQEMQKVSTVGRLRLPNQ